MFMMKTSQTFYTTDSRQVFMDNKQVLIQRIAEKQGFYGRHFCARYRHY